MYHILYLVPKGTCGTSGSAGDGYPAINALIGNVGGISVDTIGTIYLSDLTYSNIRQISFGVISKVAGVVNGGRFSGDGSAASNAYFNTNLVRYTVIY